MKRTRWFHIDVDGNPRVPGYYEVLYSDQHEDEVMPSTIYWDGRQWLLVANDVGFPLSFGNCDTAGERWRGVAEAPQPVTH